MKSFRTGALATLGLLYAALSACTDSNITAVQEASLPRSDFTFGEALDNPKGCKSTKWERSDDANGRPLVTYTCTAETFDDITQDARKTAASDLVDVSQKKAEAFPKMVDALRRRLEGAKSLYSGANDPQGQKLQAAEQALGQRRAQVDELMRRPAGNPVEQDILRRQTQEAQREITGMERQYQEIKAQIERDAPNNKLQAESAIASAQKQLDDVASWKDRYADAVKVARESVEKEVSEHYGRSHSFKLRIQFAVSSKSPITPTTIEWLLDDHPVATSILMPSFLYNPQQMEASLRGAYKDRITLKIDEAYARAFPIECLYDWSGVSTGCAVKGK